MKSLFPLPIVSLFAWLCLAVGCQRVPIQDGLLERSTSEPRVTSHQLRVMVTEFAILYADRIELRADEILANASDPEIRKNALRWKINGISSCLQAATRADPLGAYLDLWILNRQMTKLIDSPTGQELFGQWQWIPKEECYALDRRLQHINQVIGGELALGEDFVNGFANDFPLTNLYFDREPIASRYIEDIQEPGRELFQVVANLDDNIDDLKKLSIVYAEHLPKRARWEAELFLIDVTQVATVRRPLEDFSRTAIAVQRLASVAEALPQLAERERSALREIIAQERRVTLDDLDRMRRETEKQFASERAIVLESLREERKAVLDSLREEREAATDDLAGEMTRAIQAADNITLQRTDEVVQHTPGLIDHFFLRTGQLLLVIGLLCGLGLAGAALWLRRRKVPSPRIVPLEDDAAERRNAA